MAKTDEDDGLLGEIREEIEAVHRFISAWFRGDVPRSADGFAAGLGDRLSPGFVNIQPAGRVLTRDVLLASIENSHGANPRFRIEIGDVQIRYIGGDDLVLATYVERQSGALQSKPENARISSVVMRRRPGTGALEWLHIHETAVPTDR